MMPPPYSDVLLETVLSVRFTVPPTELRAVVMFFVRTLFATVNVALSLV